MHIPGLWVIVESNRETIGYDSTNKLHVQVNTPTDTNEEYATHEWNADTRTPLHTKYMLHTVCVGDGQTGMHYM